MAGLLKPRAATMLVKALKEAVDVPLHLHMHDTAGNAIGSYFAAIDAGVDVVDGAVSIMAGMTSPAVAVVAGVRARRVAARSARRTSTGSRSCRSTGSRCAS